MRGGAWMVLVAAFFWGTSFPMVEVGLGAGLGPMVFLLARFLLASALLGALAAALGRFDVRMLGDPWLWALGLVNATGYVAQFGGQALTTASKAVLLVNVNVLLTALLAGVMLKERIGRNVWWATAVGLVGLWLLTTDGDPRALSLNNAEIVGDGLTFVTGVCWTFYILIAKAYMLRKPDLDVLAFTVATFFVTLPFLVLAAWRLEGLSIPTGGAAWGAIVYLAVFSTVIAHLLWQTGLQRVPASVSALLLLFEVLVGVAVSVPLLGEGFTGPGAAGAVLLLAAIFLAGRNPAPGPAALAPAPPARE